MVSERWFSTVAVIAVIVITAGYFIWAEPEASSVTSGDGVVTVTGLARQTQPLKVKIGDPVTAPLLGSAYVVSPDGVTLDEPAVIAFSALDNNSPDRSALGVYWFHPVLKMWEPVSPVVADTNDVIAVQTAQLGEFAIGSVPTFTPPVFANVYDELRAKAPADAVGYEIAVAFTADTNQAPIRLLSVGENGGCGGAVRVGDGESVSELERTASVDVAGVPQTLRFLFVTRWFTSSTGGCGADEPLRPLVEYDILDKIQT